MDIIEWAGLQLLAMEARQYYWTRVNSCGVRFPLDLTVGED